MAEPFYSETSFDLKADEVYEEGKEGPQCGEGKKCDVYEKADAGAGQGRGFHIMSIFPKKEASVCSMIGRSLNE